MSLADYVFSGFSVRISGVASAERDQALSMRRTVLVLLRMSLFYSESTEIGICRGRLIAMYVKRIMYVDVERLYHGPVLSCLSYGAHDMHCATAAKANPSKVEFSRTSRK
jgi:hypothetical protein